MRFEFDSEVWRWEVRREGGWLFASVPLEYSTDIRELSEAMPRAGFGAVRVQVRIGLSTWRTSIFPAHGENYSLPLKAAVRKAEGFGLGDTVHVDLETLDL